MLSDAGDDVDDGRFDPRALGYPGWQEIVRPATTIESPRAKEVVEGEESSSEVEESVKARRKQHALGTLFRSHFAFRPFHPLLHVRRTLHPWSLIVWPRSFETLCGAPSPSPSWTFTGPRIKMTIVHAVADVGQHDFHTLTTASTGAVPFLLPSPSNFTSTIQSYHATLFSLAPSIARYPSSPASVQHGPPTVAPPRHIFALWDMLETTTGVSFVRIRSKQVSPALVFLWLAFFWPVDYPTSPSSPSTDTPSSPIPLPVPLNKPPNPHYYPLYASSMSLSFRFYP